MSDQWSKTKKILSLHSCVTNKSIQSLYLSLKTKQNSKSFACLFKNDKRWNNYQYAIIANLFSFNWWLVAALKLIDFCCKHLCLSQSKSFLQTVKSNIWEPSFAGQIKSQIRNNRKVPEYLIINESVIIKTRPIYCILLSGIISWQKSKKLQYAEDMFVVFYVSTLHLLVAIVQSQNLRDPYQK